MKKLNPFDIINGISKNKLFSRDEVENTLNISLLVKYLTQSNKTIFLALEISKDIYYFQSIYYAYLFVYFNFPEKTFVKWYKKNNTDIERYKDISLIEEMFNISYEESYNLFYSLNDEEKKKIFELYYILKKENCDFSTFDVFSILKLDN